MNLILSKIENSTLKLLSYFKKYQAQSKQCHERNQIIGVPGIFKNTSLT